MIYIFVTALITYYITIKQIKQGVLVHISDDFHIEFKKLDYQKKI